MYLASFVCRGATAKLRQRKPNVLVALQEISEIFQVVVDSKTKVFGRPDLFLLMQKVKLK